MTDEKISRRHCCKARWPESPRCPPPRCREGRSRRGGRRERSAREVARLCRGRESSESEAESDLQAPADLRELFSSTRASPAQPGDPAYIISGNFVTATGWCRVWVRRVGIGDSFRAGSAPASKLSPSVPAARSDPISSRQTGVPRDRSDWRRPDRHLLFRLEKETPPFGGVRSLLVRESSVWWSGFFVCYSQLAGQSRRAVVPRRWPCPPSFPTSLPPLGGRFVGGAASAIRGAASRSGRSGAQHPLSGEEKRQLACPVTSACLLSKGCRIRRAPAVGIMPIRKKTRHSGDRLRDPRFPDRPTKHVIRESGERLEKVMAMPASPRGATVSSRSAPGACASMAGSCCTCCLVEAGAI